MEKPHSFSGRTIKKYGKITTNDYAQPDKFFADMGNCLHLMDEIPFSAVEDLRKYELNRDVMINILRRMYNILRAAQVNVVEEMRRQDEDQFDGLEEDLELKKSMIKITGEEN